MRVGALICQGDASKQHCDSLAAWCIHMASSRPVPDHRSQLVTFIIFNKLCHFVAFGLIPAVQTLFAYFDCTLLDVGSVRLPRVPRRTSSHGLRAPDV